MPNRPHFNKKFCSRPSTSSSSSNSQINQTANENTTSDLPGFYYDEVKQRYFKIQSNTFGVQSVVTNESIRLLSKAKINSNNNKSTSINLIDNLIKIQFGQFDKNLINDLEVIYLKQIPLVKLENSVQIKKINTFKLNTNDKQIYFLINISGYLNNLVQCIAINLSSFKRNCSNLDYVPIRFNHLNGSNEFYGTSQTLRSSGLAYIQNNNYLVKDHYPSEEKISKKQKLTISYIDYYNRDQLNEKIIFVKNFSLPLWCSSLNSNLDQDNKLNKCVIGFPKNAMLVNLNENNLNNEQILDSLGSDVYCVKFKPSDFENQVFIGCKNKYLFGHDLRMNTKESAPIKLEHTSCLNDILFDNINTNQLYTSDLTGQIYLWDLRMMKIMHKYLKENECNYKCSLSMSNSCSYLYSIAKDGHTRIWNTKNNKQIRKILSPNSIASNNMYADIPSIQINNRLDFFYAINNEIFYFN